ncbi:MAG: hypothetical protein KAW19_03655, partial [Candidatus Aminicenantes bacterium]|nr:hypothetical protein [Candidatus Aminicenantes bacterium]
MNIRMTLIILILFSMCFSEVFGCIYNVRDVGFVEFLSAPYHLYFYINNDTPEEFTSAFNQISYTAFMDSNVKGEIINVDQKKDLPAMEYFRLWEIQSFPAAILVSPKGQSLVLPISVPKKTFKETARSSFHSIIFSPKREDILNHIVRSYCVILLIEGKDADENKRAHEVVAASTRKIAKMMSQLPKRIEKPPYIIIMPQESLSQEKMLLWSLGIDENEVKEANVAIIYGRGRRLGPILRGVYITGSRIFNILSRIGLSCECGLDRRWIMGSRIPLRWERKIQRDVVKFLGFDAESPMVKMEMSSIMSIGRSSVQMEEGNKNSSRGMLSDPDTGLDSYSE